MELNNTFTVPVPVHEAWKVLLDVERLAPCMPGAAVDQVAGDDVLGQVRVRLGPISLTYRGKLTFLERDETAHRVVFDAAAREARGSGTASARITAVLADAGGQTQVTVDTDLDVTGKPAQFGRNVMVDVSERIIDQFARNLAAELQGAPAAATEPAAAAGEPADGPAGGSAGGQPSRPARRESADSLDLLGVAGAPVLRRFGPVMVAAVLGAVLLRRLARRR